MLHSILSAVSNISLQPAWIPSGGEWLVIAVIGLLLFGKRLPEVGRSLGKGIVEFKKGLKGVEEEVEAASNAPARQVTHEAPAASLPPSQPQQPAYKFDPYTGKPIEQTPAPEAEAEAGKANA
jgi:sec-independent protein translocase protein TatA